MSIKSIVIEFRNPRNKEEADCYGITNASSELATVFLNARKNQLAKEYIDTYFHEMTHVLFEFLGHNVPTKDQEVLATKIGKICAEVLL